MAFNGRNAGSLQWSHFRENPTNFSTSVARWVRDSFSGRTDAPEVRCDLQTDTQDDYSNPPAHVRRGLIMKVHIWQIKLKGWGCDSCKVKPVKVAYHWQRPNESPVYVPQRTVKGHTAGPCRQLGWSSKIVFLFIIIEVFTVSRVTFTVNYYQKCLLCSSCIVFLRLPLCMCVKDTQCMYILCFASTECYTVQCTYLFAKIRFTYSSKEGCCIAIPS